ncbi:MAG TPA: hypothetical protein PLE91_02660 [Methanothermobacter sp.]|nr:hypothetical protein [Methanothermobacter sp.]
MEKNAKEAKNPVTQVIMFMIGMRNLRGKKNAASEKRNAKIIIK